MCHLDAEMTRQGIEGMGTAGLDLVVLENVGNPHLHRGVRHGRGEKNAMILSVPEGDDKPLKYPLMFSTVDVVLVNKIDAMGFFNFKMDAFTERVAKLNPKAKIIPISAKTGEGIAEWADWIRGEIKTWKEN